MAPTKAPSFICKHCSKYMDKSLFDLPNDGVTVQSGSGDIFLCCQ